MKFDRIYERILFDTMVCENILLISLIQILVYSTKINAPKNGMLFEFLYALLFSNTETLY